MKELAYTEFNGGKRALWERALLCHSPEIKMRNTEVLVERMSYVSCRAGNPSLTLSDHLAIPCDGLNEGAADGKMGKEEGSKVDLMEVDE